MLRKKDIQIRINLENTWRSITDRGSKRDYECLAAGDFGDTVINITSDQLKKLTKELASSYPAYAAANGKADPTKMGDIF